MRCMNCKDDSGSTETEYRMGGREGGTLHWSKKGVKRPDRGAFLNGPGEAEKGGISRKCFQLLRPVVRGEEVKLI